LRKRRNNPSKKKRNNRSRPPNRKHSNKLLWLKPRDVSTEFGEHSKQATALCGINLKKVPKKLAEP